MSYFYIVAWNLLTYTVDAMYSYDKIVFKNFKKFFNLLFFGGVTFALSNSDRNKLICYGCYSSDVHLYEFVFKKEKKKSKKKHQC